MPDWLALSDREAPYGAGPAPVAQGLFVLEFRLPLGGPAVLVNQQTDDGRALSVFHDPEQGTAVLVRSGGQVGRFQLGRLATPDLAGVCRLSLSVQDGRWRLQLMLPETGQAIEARGPGAPPLDADLIRRLADRMGEGLRHPAVLWFGLTRSMHLPHAAPWIGPNTPIETARGPIAAGRLQPGMPIRTLDHGWLPLRALHWLTLPAAGSFAPVVLRQPFFATERDLLVSADQLLLISGASVEYLTGEEEALVPAGALADGRVAERDNRRAVTEALALDLGQSALVVADGCCLLCAPAQSSQAQSAQARLPRRALQDWEMKPLLALLGRTSLRPAA